MKRTLMWVSGVVAAAATILLMYSVGFGDGFDHGVRSVRNEAVEADVAEWRVISPEPQVEFRWRKIPMEISPAPQRKYWDVDEDGI